MHFIGPKLLLRLLLSPQETDFAPNGNTALKWGSICAPGETFRGYISHLRKACALARQPIYWDTLAVRSAADGLIRARKGPPKFPNYISPSDIFRVIEFSGRWRIQSPQLTSHSYLFCLRIPSESLSSWGHFGETRKPTPFARISRALSV